MAHVRPTAGGFEVALDMEETTRCREAGIVPLVEVVQGTPAVSPLYEREEAAEAFLAGFNAGAFAQEGAIGAVLRQLRLDADEWVNFNDLIQRLDDKVKIELRAHV